MNMHSGGPSAANITPLPDFSPPALSQSPDIVFDRLILAIRDMLKRCEQEDRNAHALLAITALIEGGVDTESRIVGSAKALGFKLAHFGAFLRKSTGSIRGYHLWKRNSEGGYEVLGPAPAPKLVMVPDLFP